MRHSGGIGIRAPLIAASKGATPQPNSLPGMTVSPLTEPGWYAANSDSGTESPTRTARTSTTGAVVADGSAAGLVGTGDGVRLALSRMASSESGAGGRADAAVTPSSPSTTAGAPTSSASRCPEVNLVSPPERIGCSTR